jgi:para-nitrobenzyl esterase
MPQELVPGDEYLNLNVYTPDPGAAGLPVLVTIHGGGLVFGSNIHPTNGTPRFAGRGMVVVAINYRLGLDGFLPLRDAPPNRGVLDWLAALEWVHDNIAAFGGDPDRVTISGYSAGSAACCVLLGLPQAAGLFQRVIAMSGTAWNQVALPEAEARADEVIERIGVPARQ